MQDRRALSREIRDDLRLGRGDRLLAPQEFQVCGTHVDQGPDPRVRDLAQVADMTRATHAHLQHEEPRTRRARQHGQGQSHLRVEGSAR